MRNRELHIGGTVLHVAPDAIEREIVIEAPPGVVWSIVTEAEHLAGWFSDEAEIDLRPGGRLLLTWHAHGTYEGRVETVDPQRAFAFRWQTREGDFSEANSTLVTMTLAAEEGGHATPHRGERLRSPAVARRGARPLPGREQPGLVHRAQRASRLRHPGCCKP